MKLMKQAMALLAVMFSLNAFALPIVEDRDLVAYEVGMVPVFDAVFTQADPIKTFGFYGFCQDGVVPSDATCGSLELTISPPDWMNLAVMWSTNFDFGGTSLSYPTEFGEPALLPGGETWTVTLGGTVRPNANHYISLMVLNAEDLPLGGYPVGSAFSSGYEGPVTSVPEPGTLGMMLAGLGAMGFIARRRKKV